MRLNATLRNGMESVIWVWKTWNLHGFVLLSLCLQLILLFAAPLRKKTTKWYVVGLIWCAYQLVDTVINHALSSLYTGTVEKGQKQDDGKDLYTFWAVLLLLHFGGPDTITALSMEDNWLWIRSRLQLQAQVVRTVNVAVAAITKGLLSQPYILFSTLLILIAGLEKSSERIACLREASLRRFRWSLVPEKPNPGPDYAAILEEYNFYKSRGIPVKFVDEEIKVDRTAAAVATTICTAGAGKTSSEESLNDAGLAKQARYFYHKFKGTYVDRVLCCHDRMETRDVFLQLPPQSALTVVETEMKFAYEAFYTKAHLFADPRWMAGRMFSFCLELAALALWLPTMHLYTSIEALVTTCLLAGAVLVDILAFVRIHFSDWNMSQSPPMPSSSSSSPPSMRPLFIPVLYLRRRRWGDYPQATPLHHKVLRTKFRQWSESISQLNFINYCLVERPKWRSKLYTYLGAKEMMDGCKYVFDRWLTNHLRDFIFEELKHSSSVAQGLDRWEEVNSSRGGWTLRFSASDGLDAATFEHYILNVEYDESLLIWHIATELCYETEEAPPDLRQQEHRVFSKLLSDYMMYLSVRQSKLMSQIAPMAKVVFGDTCKEARQLFHRKKVSVHTNACHIIKQCRTDIPPSYIKEEHNNSVLFDACVLANDLMMVKRNRWKFISQIWVELLCYAASHTPGSAHVVLLTQGGELVTLVRLLMLHFGLSNQFRKAKFVPRAKLFVGN